MVDLTAASSRRSVVPAHHMKPPHLPQQFTICPLILSRFVSRLVVVSFFNILSKNDDDEKTTGKSSRSGGSGISSRYCEPTNRAWVPIVPPQF